MKIVDELGVDESSFVLNVIQLPTLPIITLGPSHSRIVKTERRYWPFSLIFRGMPLFSEAVLKNLKWFTLEVIKSGSDIDGTPIQNEILVSIQNEMNQSQTRRIQQDARREPGVPLSMVEGSSKEMQNTRAPNRNSKLTEIDLSPLGIDEILTCSIQTDFVVFKGNSSPEVTKRDQFADIKLSAITQDYELFMNDATKQLTSSKSTKTGDIIKMRTGDTLLYLSMRFILLSVGQTRGVNEWEKYVFRKFDKDKNARVYDPLKRMLRVCGTLKRKFAPLLGNDKVNDLITTGKITSSIRIGSKTTTCLAIEPQALIEIIA